MRILMLTDVYPPVLGGMERYVQRVSRDLVARGHEVSVATFALPNAPSSQVEDGVAVQRVRGLVQSVSSLHSDPRRPFAPPLPDPQATWELRRILRSKAWDIVHCHNWLVHSFLPLRAWCSAPLVFTLHDYSLVCAKKTLLVGDAPCSGPAFAKCISCSVNTFGPARGLPTTFGNWGMQLPLRLGVDLFLPVSQAVADGNRLAERHLPYRVIPNFVSDAILEPSAEIDPRVAALPEHGFLLYVGGFDRIKGLDVLLRSYAGLRDAPPLVVIGASRRHALPPLPPNVIVLTDLPESAVQSAWRRSLMGLVPSIWADPCPTVILEAMAAGRPVVASRIGGIPELVQDRETGVLVRAGDADELRRGIQELLDGPDLRDRMGSNARAGVTRFTAKSVLPQIERAYTDVRETACQAA
jgi:glycosyltransferase involved in cell wall biosynthesis